MFRSIMIPGLVVIFSISVSLGIAEGIFRWNDPKGISYQVAASRYLLELASDVSAHPLVYRQGIPNKQVGKFKLNNFGFRGSDFVIEKESSTLRILTIGDSMTVGYGVHENETWPSQLERYLEEMLNRQIDVYNLSIGGYNAMGYLGLLLNYGISLSPDVVIVLFVGNDDTIQPGNQEFYDLFPSYANGEIETIKRHQTYARDTWIYPLWKFANSTLPYLSNYIYSHILTKKRTERKQPLTRNTNLWNTNGDRLFSVGLGDMENAVNEFLSRCLKNEIKVIPVLYYKEESGWLGHDILKKTVNKHGLKLVYLRQSAELGLEYRNSESDGHFNAKGNQVVMKEMYDQIADDLPSIPDALNVKPLNSVKALINCD